MTGLADVTIYQREIAHRCPEMQAAKFEVVRPDGSVRRCP